MMAFCFTWLNQVRVLDKDMRMWTTYTLKSLRAYPKDAQE